MPIATPAFRLTLPEPTGSVPVLDADQQQVVDHPGGPLLVLAGPGTGKTTTLVEAIVERIEGRGVGPERILALTFSRKAAEQLRDRVTARLARTFSGTLSSTFHSFAYGLVRRFAPAELYAAPLRLLSAPEQDVVLAELLTAHPESVRWPEHLRAAVGTRGFAREVHAVIARARERGLDPDHLVALGQAESVPEFEAAGHFLGQYLDVLGNQSAIDYPDLIARGVIEAERHRDLLRSEYSCVFVDEFQDTDPSQVALLRALAGDGRDLVVVGDPDQSIYGFRGADVRGILEFPRAFPRHDGAPAPVVALGRTRRFGSRLLRASRHVAAGIAVRGAIPEDAYASFRHPEAVPGEFGAGRVEAMTFDTARAETEHVADLLRRAHLEDGLDWSEMAVLVRSGRSSIAPLRRALTAAGVPVEVARDETPLVREPAVMVLLAALSVVVDAGVTDPEDDHYVRSDQVEELLTSALGGLDATEIRALVRELRAADSTRPSAELLRSAVLDPEVLSALPGPAAGRALRVARLVARAREQFAAGASAEQLLWTLWDGTDWGRRLQQAAHAGGQAARYAHRDLDALVALFEAAAKAEEQQEFTSVATFLATLQAQEIPGDTLAERGVRGSSVRLMTAHRSKGLEWRLVVLARVQEGAWPDLRRRDSLLGADRIGGPGEGLLPPLTRASMLAEERRLFYVATTRARQRLVVTAVKSPDDDGEQPSRFLAELGVSQGQIRHVVGRPRRPLSMAGLVAELRRTLADPEQPEPLRRAAAARLHRLAVTEVHGKPVAPGADPATWWGMRAPSRALTPVRPEDRPVVLSASALDGVLACPAQWFLRREAGGDVVSTSSQGFGQVVHAIAQRVVEGDLAEAEVEDLMPLVDDVWGRMEFRTPWSGAREREAVREVLARFLAWHRRPGARTVLGVESPLSAEVRVPTDTGEEVVTLHGFADRLELDANGDVVVVDLKTGKYAPATKDLPAHPQLGLYQMAVDHGGADRVAGRPATAGGAELVQLRLGTDQPKVQHQDAGPEHITEQVAIAVEAIRSENFVARPSDAQCRNCPFVAMCPATSSGSVLA